jgi:hypothetical protein
VLLFVMGLRDGPVKWTDGSLQELTHSVSDRLCTSNQLFNDIL